MPELPGLHHHAHVVGNLLLLLHEESSLEGCLIDGLEIRRHWVEELLLCKEERVGRGKGGKGRDLGPIRERRE